MIPLAVTTIAIRRPPPDDDPLEQGPKRLMETGIRAVIGSPSGADLMAGGDRSVVAARLTADPCDLRPSDEVQDETTGDRYQIVWVRTRQGYGLDHVAAGLSEVVGAPNG